MKRAFYLGFKVDVETGELDAPCGCIACNDRVQDGHFACSCPPEELVEDEQEEGCWRSFNGTSWKWYAPEGTY